MWEMINKGFVIENTHKRTRERQPAVIASQAAAKLHILEEQGKQFIWIF